MENQRLSFIRVVTQVLEKPYLNKRIYKNRLQDNCDPSLRLKFVFYYFVVTTEMQHLQN